MDTAAVLGNAMTDYLLAVGARTAPAARAPEHMAEWLDAHGYRIVRVPPDLDTGGAGDADADADDLIAALVGRRSCCRDGADPCATRARSAMRGQPASTSAGWRDGARHPADADLPLAAARVSRSV